MLIREVDLSMRMVMDLILFFLIPVMNSESGFESAVKDLPKSWFRDLQSVSDVPFVRRVIWMTRPWWSWGIMRSRCCVVNVCWFFRSVTFHVVKLVVWGCALRKRFGGREERSWVVVFR